MMDTTEISRKKTGENQISAYRISGAGRKGTRLSMASPHYHDFYEIYFFYGDDMRYFLENRIYCLKKYDVIVVDTLAYHKTNYSLSKDPDRINVSFSPDILEHIKDEEIRASAARFFSTADHIEGSSYDHGYVERSLQHLICLCSSGTDDKISCRRKELILLDIILLLMKAAGPFAFENRPAVAEPDIFTAIFEYINTSFDKDISLCSIAGKFGVSRFHLCRKFRRITGTGMTGFINGKRLAEAVMLLENTDYPVTKICRLTGFRSLSYFSRLFKDTYGESPSVFRKH